MEWVIVAGTPAEGFSCVGPFATFEEAQDYLKTDWEFSQGNAWVVDLSTPAKK